MTPPDPNAAPKKTSPRPEAAAKKSKLPPLPPLPPLPKMGGKGGPPAKPELSEEEKKAEEEKRAKERAEAQQRIEARLREDAAAIEQVRAEIARLSEANAAARRDDSAESPGGEAAVNLGRLRQSLGRAAKTGNWQAASEIVRMIKKLGR
jgi:hypothetical protein